MTIFVPPKSTSLVTGGPIFSSSSFFTSISCSLIYLGADFSCKAKTFLCPFSVLCHTIYACKHWRVCLFVWAFLLVFRIKDRPQPQDLYLPCVQHGEGKSIFCFDSWLQWLVIISDLFYFLIALCLHVQRSKLKGCLYLNMYLFLVTNTGKWYRVK